MPLLKKILTFLTILHIAVWSNTLYAQSASKEAIKAEMTVRFVNHVFWKDEKNINSFRIGFLGTEPAYFENLKKAIANRLVRNKPLVLVPVSDSESSLDFQVLIVAAKTKAPFSDIALKVRETNTLVVSDQNEDQIHTMINFVHSEHNTLSFEINRSNILLEDLSISDDILLIGGTELDIAHLYRKLEMELSDLNTEFEITKGKSLNANIQLARSHEQLTDAHVNLESTSLDLQAVNETLLTQKDTISKQKNVIKTRQIDLRKAIASAERNRSILRHQVEQLRESSEKIREQKENVNNNELLLQEQQKNLAALKMDINLQSDTIRGQEQLLLTSLIVLAVFLILVFWLYRTSQDRARISRELFKRGEALEEEVRQRTAAAVNSERHYRALSESSPVGVFQTDIHGNCSYVNERWCEYSGLTRQQAMGIGWLNALHPDDRSKLADPKAPNLKTEKIFNSEYRYCSTNGKERWLVGHCEMEHNSDGVLQGYIGTVTDITDQKQLEEQVRRTQKIDALGLLTGGVAHDYNNMLAIIIGYAELLQLKLFEKPDLLNYVDQIAHASKRGATLTKKLLSFSKHSPSDAKKLDVNQLITHQCQMLEKTLTPRIILNMELDETLWPVWLDEGELEDALVNISINAMHAMEHGGTLTIQTQNIKNSDLGDHPKFQNCKDDYILLSLADTGCGVSKESLEKLFDPFYSTKGSQGTGLGLTQVYNMVERSNGIIAVESVLDEGTKFFLYFPRHIKEEITEPIVSEVETSDFHGTESVLIVDDEPALLMLASEVLTRAGYRTTCVSNAQDALTTLKTASIDLLLTDVVMPGIDGYQLALTVQKMYPNIKIQLVSGFSDEKTGKDTNNYLTKELLRKPYRSKALLQRIRTILDQEDESFPKTGGAHTIS
jgi:PAS domain S-box-containing protein